jgi:hypothetical protein
VKEHLALAQLSEGRKQILAQYLERFYHFKGIAFEKPRYRRVERLPFVPMEVEIDQLIAGVGQKSAAFLQCIKETAARPGEAWSYLTRKGATSKLRVSNVTEQLDRAPEAFTHLREHFSPRTPLRFQHEISQEGNAKPLIAVVQEIERRICSVSSPCRLDDVMF